MINNLIIISILAVLLFLIVLPFKYVLPTIIASSIPPIP